MWEFLGRCAIRTVLITVTATVCFLTFGAIGWQVSPESIFLGAVIGMWATDGLWFDKTGF